MADRMVAAHSMESPCPTGRGSIEALPGDDENLVQEEIPLGPIVSDVGAIEEDHIDEAVDKFAKLLTKAIKDAKAKHGKSKRVRIFLRLPAPGGSVQ